MSNNRRYADDNEDDDFRRERNRRHRPRRGNNDSAYGFVADSTFEIKTHQPNVHNAESVAMSSNKDFNPPSYNQHHNRPKSDFVEPPTAVENKDLKLETVEVKWFNAEKGFGFVVDSNGSDVFLHISALKTAKLATVTQGQKLVVQRGPGRKAGQDAVIRVVSAD